jgi:hypothetical protein
MSNPKLGIFSWNIQNNFTEKKFLEVSNKLQYENNENNENNEKLYPEFLALGFQEVDTPSNDKKQTIETFFATLVTGNDFFKNYEIIKNNNDNSISVLDDSKFKSCKDYAIFLILLKKKGTDFTCELKESYKDAPLFFGKAPILGKVVPKFSKGIVGYFLNFKNKNDISFDSKLSIYNCHLPFEKDVNINKEFISKLRTNILNDQTGKFTDSIIFGDLNSRSLVTDKCYVKKSETCPSNKKINTAGYCEFAAIYNNLDTSNELERIDDVEKTEPKWNQETDPLQKCGEGLEDEVEILKEKIDQEKVKELIKILKNRDFLCNPPNHAKGKNGFFDEMNESDIKFLPTYKRLSNTGYLTTIDKDKVRLPGYADRIIFNNKSNSFEPVEESYTSLFITGNDHLPVYQEFILKTPGSTAPATQSKWKKAVKQVIQINRAAQKNRFLVDQMRNDDRELLEEFDEAYKLHGEDADLESDDEDDANANSNANVNANVIANGGGKRKKTQQRRRRKRNTKSRKKNRRSINKKSRKRNYRRKSKRS